MLKAGKIFGTGLATTGLIGAGVGIGVVFRAIIVALSSKLWLRLQLFAYAKLGFEKYLNDSINSWFLNKQELNSISYTAILKSIWNRKLMIFLSFIGFLFTLVALTSFI